MDFIDKELAGRIFQKALSKGGDFCDLFFQHKSMDYIAFEDGRVNQAYTRIDQGVGIRVLSGDKTGFASTEDLTPEGLIRAAETASAVASSSGNWQSRPFFTETIPRLYSPDPLWSGVSPSDSIHMVDQLGRNILEADPSIIKAEVYLNCSDESILLVNSEGLWMEENRPMTTLYASATSKKGNQIEKGRFGRSARKGPEFYTPELLKKIEKETVERTLFLFEARVPPAGEQAVVLAPGTSGILLHEAMGHGFEADFNRKNISLFSSSMHQQIAPDFVNIVDSGLEADCNGAIQMDDEGVASQRTTLVDKGKLVSYLHDRISAKHYGVSPTGNGRRQDFRSIPLPRMRCTFMENGPHHPEEIIASVKKGIYAEDFSNGQVDIGGGDFSFYVQKGYLIEDGRLTAPIKDANIIGNGPDCLKKITMAGRDMKIHQGPGNCGKNGQMVPVGFGLPTVKISSINVGGVNQ